MKKAMISLCAVALIAGACSCSKQQKAVEEAEGTTAATAVEGQEPKTDEDAEGTTAETSPLLKTPSGLCYRVVKEGDGAKPSASSVVNVHYTGMHVDGSTFDGPHFDEPVSFPLNGVIPGFAEGLMLMSRGARYTLYIPGDLGYGERGVPQAGIMPNETLVFDVELVDFQ